MRYCYVTLVFEAKYHLLRDEIFILQVFLRRSFAPIRKVDISDSMMDTQHLSANSCSGGFRGGGTAGSCPPPLLKHFSINAPPPRLSAFFGTGGGPKKTVCCAPPPPPFLKFLDPPLNSCIVNELMIKMIKIEIATVYVRFVKKSHFLRSEYIHAFEALARFARSCIYL